MSSGPESKLQQRCLAELKERHIWCLNVYGSGLTGRGCPDVLACVNGRFVAFEFKTHAKGSGLRDAQRVQISRIENSGGTVFVPRDYEEFVEDLDSVIEQGLGDSWVPC